MSAPVLKYTGGVGCGVVCVWGGGGVTLPQFLLDRRETAESVGNGQRQSVIDRAVGKTVRQPRY